MVHGTELLRPLSQMLIWTRHEEQQHLSPINYFEDESALTITQQNRPSRCDSRFLENSIS